ncbi:polyprenyl synthetase family protein [Blattabacterium cuenoti]|uniref:polyprenyl synthetase family protein n=1 Tax=Blattabacterium cuenoti TaxID=1653831 RepID=UPI00163BFF25|nr:polyprenyl synthetase family protein [Blattabacterium cuenoti]
MKFLLEKAKIPIKEEIEIFEKQFFYFVKSDIHLINKINNYILKKKGKLIRPILIFLIAKMLGTIKEKTYHTAYIIELIHTATLIHDDVIDNSNYRRGKSSLNAIWNNKISVLTGDYLLSRSLLLASNNNYLDLLKIVCKTIKNMSEGEMLQIEKSINISEKIYDEIICKKTASLISASCEGGAISVNANSKHIFNMKKFGFYAGIAFQIKDDLFDYENFGYNNYIGKPVGCVDIKNNKITLPLIYTIKNASSYDKKQIINYIKNYNEKKKRKIIYYINKYNGIEYAKKKMIKFHNNALNILEIYPEGIIKESLKIIVKFIINRNQ